MRTVLILVLLPIALALAVAGCHGEDHAVPTASPALPLPSSNGPKPTIEIPPPP